MAEGEITAIAKPVFAANWGGAASRFIKGLYGTALPLGRDLLLTADHVVANVLAAASRSPDFAIGWGTPRQWHTVGGSVPFTPASVAARWPEVDLAALRLRIALDNIRDGGHRVDAQRRAQAQEACSVPCQML
jgi:hypothetical protein